MCPDDCLGQAGPEQVLHIAHRADGLAVNAAEHLEAQGARLVGHAGDGFGASVGVSNDAVLAEQRGSDLELGFDQRDQLGIGGEEAEGGRQDLA